MKVAALAGGVGAAKLLLGLSCVADPRALTIIVNTGDDIVLHGLHISPDPDIVTYTLAGIVDPETGWGVADDTFRVLEQLKALGRPVWFRLGDRDLAVHLHRTEMLRGGASLSEAADSLRRALGVEAEILPMSDDFAPTYVETGEGRLHLQDYLVKRRAEPAVRAIAFDGIEKARPAPGVIEALAAADAIAICPSNPLISIGPILAVPGIRDTLRARLAKVLAVCPLVGGKSLKGPSDKMMKELGLDASAAGVAKMYADICSKFVIDDADAGVREKIEALGMTVIVCPTVMKTLDDKKRLARDVLAAFA